MVADLKRNVLNSKTANNAMSTPSSERKIFLAMVLQMKTKFINYPI
jgi:hypothetical protein